MITLNPGLTVTLARFGAVTDYNNKPRTVKSRTHGPTLLSRAATSSALALFIATALILVSSQAIADENISKVALKVEDKALRSCIEAQARSKNWQSQSDVVSLKCHNKGIQSIDGLEHFAQLEKLSLFKNSIKTFDISAYPALRSLNLARNSLESIKLVNHSAIEEVFLFDNKLKNLKPQNLPALRHLKANANKMLVFEYADLQSLQKIYLFNNELETIDIYNLPSLKHMDVRQNPMPDELYEEMDRLEKANILHDGNAEDWNP